MEDLDLKKLEDILAKLEALELILARISSNTRETTKLLSDSNELSSLCAYNSGDDINEQR